jgi:hypothetical protein
MKRLRIDDRTSKDFYHHDNTEPIPHSAIGQGEGEKMQNPGGQESIGSRKGGRHLSLIIIFVVMLGSLPLTQTGDAPFEESLRIVE